MPLVHQALRRIAQKQLGRETPGHTLQPTELIHEAYLKLLDQSRVRWQERRQFYSIAARLMRRVLVDHARSRAAEKRGGQAVLVTLNTRNEPRASREFEVIALNQALERLAEIDPRQTSLVELLYFGGLNFEEAATVLKVSLATAKRDWVHARAWLYRELAKPGDRDGDAGNV